MTALAIDLGTRHVGVALGSEGSVLWAKTLDVKGESESLSLLSQLIRKESIDTLIFGLPLRLDGSERGEAAKVRDFAKVLSQEVGRPIIFIDERLTTEEARGLLREQRVSQNEIGRHLDAAVAKLLLEQYYREQE